MATLTPQELVELRKGVAVGEQPDWTKDQVNAMLQAIEDWFEGERAAVSTAINTATSPYVFTNAQKKKAVAHFLRQKFRRENI